MKKTILMSSMLSLALTQTILAESPVTIEPPVIDKPTVCPQPLTPPTHPEMEVKPFVINPAVTIEPPVVNKPTVCPQPLTPPTHPEMEVKPFVVDPAVTIEPPVVNKPTVCPQPVTPPQPLTPPTEVEIEVKPAVIDKPTVCPQPLTPPQPPEIVEPIDSTEEVIEETPIFSAKPNDYSISLLIKGRVDMCKGVVIAPSWVLTAKHCATTKLSHVTDGKRKDKVKIAKKIRFKKSDIALLKLAKPVFGNKNIVMLSAKPLLKEYSKLDYRKVTHNASRGTPRVYGNLILRANNQKSLKSLTPVGKAGSSGSPWVVSTDVGDVVVGVTHGGGYASQVSFAKSWIDATLKTYTPTEQVKWLTDREMILNAQ